jgi:signal transduction histidine kinase
VPDAPALDERVTPSAAHSITALSRRLQPDRAEVLVRTPWPDSRCAFVLARGTTEPWLGALLPPTRIWALPALMVLVTVLLAVGPVVRRIRVLTRAVQRSAAFDYADAVSIAGDDEIAELARAFAAAGREVRAQLAAKDRREQALRNFVADTTHDVAIPLTVLQGHLATLQECVARESPLSASALASAMSEAHYIGALLHNLSAAAKLDAADPQLARGAVDLGALVARVVSRHRPLARQRDVLIESAVPDGTVQADADVTLLEQAVSNIVYNAVRYNRAGGHVAVLLETPSAAEFRIRVLDDGPGVPAETLVRLSERGFRGTQARTRDAAGQGLGLHITQRVVDTHGMRLQLSSPEAGGLQVDLSGARC